jgi:hypothetical protein
MHSAHRSVVALALPGLVAACDPGRSVVPGPNDLVLAVREVHRLGNAETLGARRRGADGRLA